MTRIEPLTGARAPAFLRVLNVLVRRFYGRELVPLNLMAYNPRLILPYLFMSGFATGRTRLDPRLRSLAEHLVSERNGCMWCLDFGAAQAGRYGVAAEKLALVGSYASNPLFSDAERAALAFADAVTQVGAPVSDDQFAALRRWFSDQEIVELLAAVCAHNFFNRFNAALGIEAQGFCAVPSLRRAA
jgi:AhpD family alkylhydroperoxidase